MSWLRLTLVACSSLLLLVLVLVGFPAFMTPPLFYMKTALARFLLSLFLLLLLI